MRRSPSANRHWFTSEPVERTLRPLWVRIVFGVVAGLLVCCAAVAAQVILADSTGGRRPSPEPAITTQGALALRPDVIREARRPFEPPADAGGESASRTPGSSGATQARDTSAIELVRDFCRRLDTDPERAVALVSGLPAKHRAQVVHAWTETESVRLRWVRPRPDDSLIAEVMVRYPDGNTLDLRYRFTVRPGGAARIVGVELLNAKYRRGG